MYLGPSAFPDHRNRSEQGFPARAYLEIRLNCGTRVLGLEQIVATAETALYNGGSPWAQYWQQTVIELRDRMTASGELDQRSIDAFLVHCADPSWWTQTIAFTAVHARVTS